jgi:phosphoribosyl 1,2-cyclic phosphodiesterase
VRVRFRVLGSGSSGNTTLVEAGGTWLLIDAGLGPREMAERLASLGIDPASIAAIVLTHEHNDHARGAASFSKKWGVRLAGSRGTYAAGGFGAVDIEGWDVLEPGQMRAYGGASVTGVPIPHDAAGPMAYVVAGDGVSMGHATDFGHVNRALVDAFRPCDTVFVESNYDPAMLRDGSYPWSLKERILGRLGHLSNGDVADYIARGLGETCRTLVLGHLSRNNNHPELARMSAENALRRRGRTEVRLEIAEPDGMDWIAVAPPPRGSTGPEQLRLF